VRFKISGSAARPRVAVSRSIRHISAQVIDDDAGRTLAAASSVEPTLRGEKGTPTEIASKVGKLLAERAKAAGVTTIVFDRGGFAYHGRVAALADAIRNEGVEF
jgi:large subunit ribosomal protein L18